MNRLTLTLILALGLTACAAPVQRQIQHMHSNTVDVSTLEGVTLKNGQSTMLILANARIQQLVASNNTGMPATFLQKVGPYEIHRSSARVAATGAGSARPNFMVNGKSVPVFADDGTGQDFLGVAYLMDTKQMGLISKEVAVKFKTSAVPTHYADLGAKELVPRSGLYLFTLNDIYTWINLVSILQADAEVSLVEPQIKTEFVQSSR